MANDDSIIHGNTMYSLARLLLQQGQPLEAQPLMEQALRIFEKVTVRVCVGTRRGVGGGMGANALNLHAQP